MFWQQPAYVAADSEFGTLVILSIGAQHVDLFGSGDNRVDYYVPSWSSKYSGWCKYGCGDGQVVSIKWVDGTIYQGVLG
jgi:hypothetical protein